MYSKYFYLSKLVISLTLLSGIIFSTLTQASLVIIVHPDNTLSSLPQSSVRKIFLRKVKSFPNGSLSKPAEIKYGELRAEFTAKVLKKSESTLSSYWARMLFSGKSMPPKQFTNQIELKSYVASHKQAIAYIDSNYLDRSVKVISMY